LDSRFMAKTPGPSQSAIDPAHIVLRLERAFRNP
jgi:hypothetical protein